MDNIVLNKPKVNIAPNITPNIAPKITKINNLVESADQIRKTSTKLRKVFEKGTYQKKTQLSILNRYKRRLDSIQKQNDKRFSQKKQVKIKLPEIKKFTGNFFSAGSTNDPLKSLGALAAFNALSKGSKGDYGGAIGPALVAAGAFLGPALLGGGLNKIFNRGKAGGTSPSGSTVGKGVTAAPKQLSSKSISRLNASQARFIKGEANIGDRARLVRRGFISPRGMFSRGGVEQTAKYGANASKVGKAFGRFGKAIIPGVGAAVGAIDATLRAREGDITGSTIAGTSATLDALAAGSAATGIGLPVAGLLSIASFALDVTNLVRDLSGASEKEAAKNKPQQDKLKTQTQKQKTQVEKQKKSEGQLTFSKTLNSYEKVVNKFEEFSKNFKSSKEIASELTEGGPPTPPTTGPGSINPYTGPIDKDSFSPLPGGILSTAAVGVPKGEYGASRGYPGGHSGQDIGGLPGNSPVVAWKTGTVTVEPGLEGPDNIITIDHGGGVYTKYKHVIAEVKTGDIVYGGQQIARLLPGKEEVRGRAYDTHLHFEVWRNGRHVNPNPDISAAQKISSPLTKQRAEQEYRRRVQVQQPQTPTPRQQQTPRSAEPGSSVHSVSEPIVTSSIDAPATIKPPMPTRRSIEYYDSTSGRLQDQAITIPIPVSSPPQVMSEASPGMMLIGPSEIQMLNSYYKRILLNTLQ